MQRPNSQHRAATCVFLFYNSCVLLGRKQRGIGAGVLNGFGGAIDFDETAEAAVRREFREETGGAEILDPAELGSISCSFRDVSLTFEIHVFRATRYVGNPRNTEEMRVAWYPVANVPLGEMWPGDRLWFPYVVDGARFRGRIQYDSTEDRRVLEHHVRALEAVR